MSSAMFTARSCALLLLWLIFASAFATSSAVAQKAGEHASEGYQADESTSPNNDSSDSDDDETSATEVLYELDFEGSADSAIISLLRSSSQLERLQSKPPASLPALERRIEKDIEAFDKALRSEGYYANNLSSRIKPDGDTQLIVIMVETGPIFRLETYKVEFQVPTGETAPAAISPTELGIEPGAAARSEDIVAAQRQAVRLLGTRGFPRAEVSDQKAVVDHATMTMSVVLMIDTGPAARFGALSFSGLTGVEEDYLRRLARWPLGEVFDRTKLATLRRDLSGTGLFDSVKVSEADTVGADGQLPVVAEVKERERRSLGAGVDYSSSEGAGTRFFWEHRNIFGEAERLRGDLVIAELRQELSGSFIKPDIWQLDQDLRANAGIRHEDTEAFEEQTIEGFLGLERKWRDNWTVGAGTSFEYSIIDDQEGEDTFALIGLPLTARYDNSDDLLDPTTGFRIGTSLTPYVGVITESTNFLRGEVNASTYYSVLEEDRLILAARGTLGSIAGEETDDIPATKRFYAGGGGSVRGYEFRTLGPLDENDDPLGGRSIVEVGFEARVKVTDEIGIVPFVEGGNVFDDEVPDFSEELQWAAGLGFRYYTAVGPLRLDVAVPVNPRDDDIDDAFQFYISLGQAF